MVMLAQKDAEFNRVLNEADMNIPDGIGIIYASKIKKRPIKERVAGYDTVQAVFERIRTTDKTVYFFGGAPGVTDDAKAEMERVHSGLKITGCANGYFDEAREKEIIAEINEKKPDLLLVGIGFPKQEKWIYNHLGELNVKVAIGVGGSFDVMSGKVKRAPDIFIKLGLEWFHRLITQPSRFVRMLQLPLFMLRVIFSSK
jgi:N-acetylglucosaminyldiphosphoundecaprenol N-acetyl-beta-D-mannosaminyltransferase